MSISVRLYHDKEGKTNFCGSDSIGYFDGRKTLKTCIIEQKKRFVQGKRITGQYNNGYARFFIGDLLNHNWITDYIYVGDIPQNEYDLVLEQNLQKYEKWVDMIDKHQKQINR